MVLVLGLSEVVYGLGVLLFFIGYFLFEALVNLIFARVGARVWFARIMFSWGLVTLALGFIQNAAMFYVLCFLFGVVEVGFFFGVLYVLTLWYPQAHRARMVGLFMIASAFANAVGAVIGGLLLGMDGFLGLAGWQWVFLVTGAPAVLLALYVLWWLPSGPSDARWLPDVEKSWLASTLAAERGGEVDDHRGAWKAIFDPRVLMLAGLYIGMPLSAYGLSYWLPTIVKSFGVSNTVNGFINVIPWLLVAVALWFVPRHAARHGASAWHIAGPVLLAAVALSLSVILPGAALKFTMLCIAAPAIFAAQPVFWSLPPSFLSGPRAAAGIATINAVGNLGGFIAQNLVPVVRDATGSELAPMLALAAVLLVTSLLIFIVMGRLRKMSPAT